MPLLLVVATLVAGAPVAQPVAPVLTLKGPLATRYGHRVEFVGRLTPSVPRARIRLVSGSRLVAVRRLRPDGTYRIPVRLGRPGPFHTTWRTASSKSVTVRIHPSLQATLVGSRRAGEPLVLVTHLRPAEAGRIHVRIVRANRQTFSGTFPGRARVELGTTRVAPLQIEVTSLPRRGYASVSRAFGVSLRPPALASGSRSPFVRELLRRLFELRYATPSPRDVFDGDVIESVYAFEKAQGLPRTGTVDGAFWRRLEQPAEPEARYSDPAAHIEVEKAKQILLLVRGGQVQLIVPVSTAGIPGYYTPVGRFAIYRKVPGYDPSPLGVLYKPMYFTGGYAIHGNPSVPPYPASHGCVRVPNFVIERLYATEPYGETVYVY